MAIQEKVVRFDSQFSKVQHAFICDLSMEQQKRNAIFEVKWFGL